MRKITLVAAAVVIALVPTSASAASTADPEDSGGGLDVKRIISVYDSGTGVLTLKVKTYDGWGCKFLRRGVKTSLNWYLDDGEDGDVDLTGKLVCVEANKDPRLAFKLHGNDTGNNYEFITASRPNRRMAVVKMPTDLAEFDSDHVSVSARSRDGISSGCNDACPDRAPDSGGMRVY